ncbi:dihydrofolate reductase [Ephemerocybe angulata]|uniref:Dihydrofolate reductase n=1 Tax=Ephemerocybe angulata TaxID=980116 RepID=A0A8H6IKC4_9AGAR|nr:dihydrofolate reductase [Tulosesus angulatus]
MSRLTIIVAATKSNGIGQNGQLPWRLPKEIKYFAQVTSNAPEGTQNAVIMGRNTWESIPKKFRPYRIAQSLAKSIHRGFIIGGAHLYRETLKLAAPSSSSAASQPYVDRVLLTRVISPDFDCDVFMPEISEASGKWVQASHAELQEWVGVPVAEGVQEEKGVQYEFQMWTRE